MLFQLFQFGTYLKKNTLAHLHDKGQFGNGRSNVTIYYKATGKQVKLHIYIIASVHLPCCQGM